MRVNCIHMSILHLNIHSSLPLWGTFSLDPILHVLFLLLSPLLSLHSAPVWRRHLQGLLNSPLAFPHWALVAPSSPDGLLCDRSAWFSDLFPFPLPLLPTVAIHQTQSWLRCSLQSFVWMDTTESFLPHTRKCSLLHTAEHVASTLGALLAGWLNKWMNIVFSKRNLCRPHAHPNWSLNVPHVLWAKKNRPQVLSNHRLQLITDTEVSCFWMSCSQQELTKCLLKKWMRFLVCAQKRRVDGFYLNTDT